MNPHIAVVKHKEYWKKRRKLERRVHHNWLRRPRALLLTNPCFGDSWLYKRYVLGEFPQRLRR